MTDSPRWLDSEQQQTWRRYLLGNALLRERLDAGLRRFGLDLGEYEILVTLVESANQRLRMSELAEAVHHSRSRLTHTIGRMERDRLVERATCPADRRGVWAVLTEQGRELLGAAAPCHLAAVRANLVDIVSREDLAAVGRVFQAVIDTGPVSRPSSVRATA